MDNRLYEQGSEEWLDNDVYHAYHSGSSRHKLPPPLKPKVKEVKNKLFE